jgi:hypothetical protein
MATYNKFNGAIEDIFEKVHDMDSDQWQIALTTQANAPTASTATTLSSITQIAYTNLSAQTITTTSGAQTSGTYKLVLADLVLTASGAVATFREVVLFNQTAASDQMIAWWEHTADVTLASTDTFTIDFDATNGVLQAS